ncbi:MAG: ATP-binding protein, partial [Desulfobacteraceae bacterium]
PPRSPQQWFADPPPSRSSLKSTEKLNLEALAKSQRNTIDLFLLERKMNIRNLFYNRLENSVPSVEETNYFLMKLKQINDSFVDVGFLNDQGIQIRYAGPFPQLKGKSYKNEQWFKTLAGSRKDYFITDIYLGFRNKPHFTIAVKQTMEGTMSVLRTTIDPDKFYTFLRSISKGREVETTVINQTGTFQIVDPNKGNLLEKSTYLPPLKKDSGVTERKGKNGIEFIAFARLNKTPWILIISQPLHLVHAQMYKTRNLISIILICVISILSFVIWFFLNRFVKRAQVTAENSHLLQSQLIHASKLASVGELATGIAHEINNPLAIITSTTGVVRDLINPELELDSSPESINKELDIIESAAFRASGITRQLLDFGRKNPPRRRLCNINELLDKTILGVKQLQFDVENIELIKKYDPDLPLINVDPDRISQVFLNLINNAGDAISSEKGTIIVSTAQTDGFVRIKIQDNGMGMEPEQIEQIFNPFYTTKDPGRGTGLGLSISLKIIDTMNGSLEVQSLPGQGSLFTVSLPVDTNGKESADSRGMDNENPTG